jgi:hypothetical protein
MVKKEINTAHNTGFASGGMFDIFFNFECRPNAKPETVSGNTKTRYQIGTDKPK